MRLGVVVIILGVALGLGIGFSNPNQLANYEAGNVGPLPSSTFGGGGKVVGPGRGPAQGGNRTVTTMPSKTTKAEKNKGDQRSSITTPASMTSSIQVSSALPAQTRATLSSTTTSTSFTTTPTSTTRSSTTTSSSLSRDNTRSTTTLATSPSPTPTTVSFSDDGNGDGTSSASPADGDGDNSGNISTAHNPFNSSNKWRRRRKVLLGVRRVHFGRWGEK